MSQFHLRHRLLFLNFTLQCKMSTLLLQREFADVLHQVDTAAELQTVLVVLVLVSPFTHIL
jgi:hypothetical protein